MSDAFFRHLFVFYILMLQMQTALNAIAPAAAAFMPPFTTRCPHTPPTQVTGSVCLGGKVDKVNGTHPVEDF